mgnify:CR=1 FL=1
MKTLTVLVPIFNEARTIQELVRQLGEIQNGVISECIFVNDGSTDASLALLNKSLEKVAFKFQIVSQKNGGKASAIHAGAKLLSTSHVIILDSDLELETSDVAVFWKIVIDGRSDFVFGYRKFLAHSSFTYRYSRGNQVLSNLYGILFNEVITDIMCGYKLVPTKVLQDLPYKFKKFAIEIEIPIYLWKQRIRPHEVKVGYSPRSRLDGKMISAKDAVSIIFTLITHRALKARR